MSLYPLSLSGTSWLKADIHYWCPWETHFFSKCVSKACKALPNRSTAWCVRRLIIFQANKKKISQFYKMFLLYLPYLVSRNMQCLLQGNDESNLKAVRRHNPYAAWRVMIQWMICAEEGGFRCCKLAAFLLCIRKGTLKPNFFRRRSWEKSCS